MVFKISFVQQLLPLPPARRFLPLLVPKNQLLWHRYPVTGYVTWDWDWIDRNTFVEYVSFRTRSLLGVFQIFLCVFDFYKYAELRCFWIWQWTELPHFSWQLLGNALKDSSTVQQLGNVKRVPYRKASGRNPLFRNSAPASHWSATIKNFVQ